MLNNVKNFVISKREAFKVGYDPSLLQKMTVYTMAGCLIGASTALITNTVSFTLATIRNGENLMALEEIKKFFNED